MLETLGTESAIAGYLDTLTLNLMDEFEVPSVGLTVVRNGKIILSKTFSHASYERFPISKETLFNMASISKTLTAWGIMNLVEKGLIDLESPVNRYLKRWQIKSEEYDTDSVTIKRLLSHTAGIYVGWGAGYNKNDSLPTILEALNGENDSGKPVDISYPPGSQSKYSAYGYAILQLLVEDVSGMSFNEYMKTQIFDPLSMKSSNFDDPILHIPGKSIAQAYEWDSNPFDTERFANLAAGGMLSNLSDMTQFLIADMGLVENSVLSIPSINSMHVPIHPSKYFGMGHIIVNDNGVQLIGHNGINIGWRVDFEIFDKGGDAMLIMTNSDNGNYLADELICNYVYVIKEKELAHCQTCVAERIEIATERYIKTGIVLLLGIIILMIFRFIRYRRTKARINRA